MSIDQTQAEVFLNDHFGEKPSHVELIGAGAWSQCFGFQLGWQELAIRFGRHVEDFRKDQLAHAYASDNLPIP